MGRIKAGELTKRVMLLTDAVQSSVPNDGRGGFIPTAPPLALPRWAKVRPLSGGEILALGQVLNSNAYQVTLRNDLPTGVTAKGRVQFDGVTTNIQRAVIDPVQSEYLVLTCFDSGKQPAN